MNNLKLVNVMIRTMIEEGNHLEAEYGGYKYEIKRVPHSGALCGYIYMDKATKEEYEILNHYFHCGVTWGDEEGSRHGKYGFDCNHSYDLSPYWVFSGFYESEGYDSLFPREYRNMEYVEGVIKQTIDKLNENKLTK